MFFTKGGFVYIMTNRHHNVLYVGVTSNLTKRIEQHRNGEYRNSFTSKYKCNKLVYYCGYTYIAYAIAEEKRIKGGSRIKKIALIEGMNPEWKDLWAEISVDD